MSTLGIVVYATDARRIARLRPAKLRALVDAIEAALAESGCTFRGDVASRHEALSQLLDQVLDQLDREAAR